MGRRTIALYGGSFDPPHVAHVLTVAWTLSAGGVDEVWVLPVWRHALDKAVRTPFEDRVSLCRAAFELFGRAVVVREDEAQTGATGRTLDLVRGLGIAYPDVRFRFVVGSDILHERARWHRFDDVAVAAPLIVMPRAGWPVPPGMPFAIAPIELPAVSSSQVRAALARGDGVGGVVPDAVRTAIAARGLYTS
ncbi:MAG: nicotinate-nicotinamide nucleotide adenylyltransferase [Myxococcales bacterium]|nr:nicotinate-nicotinamide nucleotide adenylyltransferase [Myxococcales bacterium]